MKRKRKTFTDEQRRAAVAALDKGATCEEVAKRYGVGCGVIYRWRSMMRDRPATGTKSVLLAVALLRKGRAAMIEDMRAGRLSEPDNAHLHMQLALNVLLGK